MGQVKALWIGKALYGLFFAVVLPVLLFFWAGATEAVVRLPAVHAPYPGAAAAAVGLALLALGMRALVVQGGGLPMNAYPPPRYVTGGIYRYLSQPIYVGFVLTCLGVSLVLGSASGLWLVSPAAAAGAAALVLGYERHDLERRFGHAVARPLLALPPDDGRAPGFWEKLSIYLLVLAPWLAAVRALQVILPVTGGSPGGSPFAAPAALHYFDRWAVAGALVGMLLAPLAATSNRRLRAFGMRSLWALVISGLLFSAALAALRGDDLLPAALPAVAAVCSLLAATVLAPRLPLAWGWAAAVCVAGAAGGKHGLIAVSAALMIFVTVCRIEKIWVRLRGLTERAANSWKEWRLGGIRVMSHGFFAGLAGFVGLLYMGALVGDEHLGDLFAVCVVSLAGAGLWAQLIEGSSALLRPFGYYGAVVGAVVGAMVVRVAGGEGWTVLAAVSMAAPGMQAIGRVRCLIQGCCHGRACDAEVGIRYHHPRSRVVRLARLGGVPVHPTPLYSILWNAASGLLLLPLWFAADLPPSFICGIYLMLNGLGRFVEESYRGEPQTPRKAGLPIYQWNAVASLAVGAMLTCIDSGPLPAASVSDWGLLAVALVFGLLATAAMGIDFPLSNRRFSRLT